MRLPVWGAKPGQESITGTVCNNMTQLTNMYYYFLCKVRHAMACIDLYRTVEVFYPKDGTFMCTLNNNSVQH